MTIDRLSGGLACAPPPFVPSAAFPHTLEPCLYGPRRWQSAERDEEKRQCYRRSLRCEMTLVDNLMEPERITRIPAECVNVSDHGLFGIVRIGYGVCVGQRYTFQLAVGERGPEPGSLQIISQQGEIVRIELLLDATRRGDLVGIGVKLLGHRSGIIPMPMQA